VDALVDVRNANAAGIPFEICQRGIVAFSELWKAKRYWKDGGSRYVFTFSFCSAFQPLPCGGGLIFQGLLLTLLFFFGRQLALFLMLKICNLWNHLSQFKQDVANLRCLGRLIHQRVKLLKYLKCTKYERVSGRLGLKHGAVQGEL
jgi:ribosomal protein S15P/S13E